jgi:hypothetical protein
LANIWKAMAAYEQLHAAVKPSEGLPRVLGFATSVLNQAATTCLECSIAASIKMGGGMKKNNFLGVALVAFKTSTGNLAPSDFVHPALVELMK